MQTPMLLANGETLLTQKEVAHDLGVTVRAFQNYRRRWPRQLKPARTIGAGQLLWPPDVIAVTQTLLTQTAFKRYGIK